MADFSVTGRVTFADQNTIIVQYHDLYSRPPVDHAVTLYATSYAQSVSLDQTVSMAVQGMQLVVHDDSGMLSYQANIPYPIARMKANFDAAEQFRAQYPNFHDSGGGQ